MVAFFSMCFTGGFFAMLAICKTLGSLASAETANLVEIVHSVCLADWPQFFIRFAALVLYSVSILLSYILSKKNRFVGRVCAIFVDACAAVVIYIFSIIEIQNKIFFLMPVFFSMAFQWMAFGELNGCITASIFSTNNLRQAIIAAYEKNKVRFFVYSMNLLCFHIGAAWYFFAEKFWHLYSSLAIIPVLAFALTVVILTRNTARNDCTGSKK